MMINFNAILSLVESIIMMFFLYFVLEIRYKNKITLIGPFLLYGIISYIANDFSMISKMLISIISAFVVCLFVFKDSVLVKIGCLAHSFYIFTISDIMVVDLISLINKDSIYSTILTSGVSTIIFSLIVKLFNIILFALSIFIIRKVDKRNYYWICFDFIIGCFLIISIAFAALYPVITYNPEEMKLFLFLSILFFISSFLILFLFMKLSVYIKKDHYWAVTNLKNASLIKQLELQKGYIEETNKIRHDIKKMLNTINYLFVEKQYSSLEDYLSEISDQFHPSKSISYSGNQFIDSVINYKLTECKTQKINLELKISPQIETPLDANDNILIIANILDNAIEAVKKLEDENKQILFSLYNYERTLVICSKNSFINDNNKSDFFITSKQDTRLHGYGIDIIQDIVKKYHGQISIEHDSEVFDIIIMLPI